MPYYRCDLEVPLPPETVGQRLQEMIGRRPGFLDQLQDLWNRKAGPVFYGSLSGGSFKISRNIRYNNSFLPQIRGRIEPTGGGSRVAMTMFVHPAVAVFMLIWSLGAAAGGAVAFQSLDGPYAIYIPLGILIVVIALPTAAFYPEAFKAKRLIAEALGNTGVAG
jgi:hypothetical protein